MKASSDKTKPLMRASARGFFRVVFSRTTMLALLLCLNFALVILFWYGVFRRLPFLFGSVAVMVAMMELVILNDKSTATVKLSWSVIVAVLPLFGIILYGITRFDVGSRLSRRLIQSSVNESLQYIEDDTPLQESIRDLPTLSSMAFYLKKYAAAPVYANTEVRYFPLGEDMYEELLRAIGRAERFVFLEYFLVSEGVMWNSILDLLVRKAEAGVEVRVLYDGMNTIANLPYHYPKLLQTYGIAAKVHAPLRPFVSLHYNNRDHRKIAVIDGHTAFTGGVNLEDCYINQKQRFGHWKDTAVMLRGEAARSFTLLFLQMWNATERRRDYAPYLSVPMPPITAPGYVIPYGDNPTDKEYVGQTVYMSVLSSAKQYVYVMTPYLILDSEMAAALKITAKRGVDVRLLLPHIPDKKSAFALARSHYGELLEAGVRIYEYTPGFVHAKVFLCDDLQAVVGSINLDYRSFYHHYECAAYLYDVPAISDIRLDFETTMARSVRITPAMVKGRPLSEKLRGILLKVLAPLM